MVVALRTLRKEHFGNKTPLRNAAVYTEDTEMLAPDSPEDTETLCTEMLCFGGYRNAPLYTEQICVHRGYRQSVPTVRKGHFGILRVHSSVSERILYVQSSVSVRTVRKEHFGILCVHSSVSEGRLAAKRPFYVSFQSRGHSTSLFSQEPILRLFSVKSPFYVSFQSVGKEPQSSETIHTRLFSET